MISPLLANSSVPALVELGSVDLFRPDVHMPINLPHERSMKHHFLQCVIQEGMFHFRGL